jgi:hypothetical protein
MNLGIFCRQAPLLPHVAWPVEPLEDESLAGLLLRSASHNAISRPSILTTDAGLPSHQRIGSIAASGHPLRGLADMLAVDAMWVEEHRHPILSTARGGNAKTVLFHGATIRRAHLEEGVRLFSSAALADSPHHREAWHIASLPVDVPTWTMLTDRCPHEDCGRTLGWTRTKGVAICEHCMGALTSAEGFPVPEDWRQWVAIAAGILSRDQVAQEAAIRKLPATLHMWDRGDIHELAWLLGLASDDEFETASVDPTVIQPARRLIAIGRGYELLSAWPASFASMVKSAIEADPAGGVVTTLVSRLRGAMKRSSTFGRAAQALSEALGTFHTNSFATTMGRAIGHYTTRGFSTATGISRSDIRSLRRAGLIKMLVLRDKRRTMALYPPSQVELVQTSTRSRQTLRTSARRLGIGVDAVLALISTGQLRPADDLITRHLQEEPQVDLASLDELVERLEDVLITPNATRTLTIRVAYRRLPGCEKPWPALIAAVLGKSIRLHRNATESLSLRDCRISHRDLTKLDRLARHDYSATVASPWISDHDAWERLNCGMRNLRHLVRTDMLESSGRLNGQTFLRSDVDRLASELICVPEIKARLAESGMWIEPHLAEHGLVPDHGGFLPRTLTEGKLGLV